MIYMGIFELPIISKTWMISSRTIIFIIKIISLII